MPNFFADRQTQHVMRIEQDLKAAISDHYQGPWREQELKGNLSCVKQPHNPYTLHFFLNGQEILVIDEYVAMQH